MKGLTFLFAVIIMAATILSCSKDMIEDYNVTLKSGNVASTPESDTGVLPYVIPGANKGGNRTCSEVAIAFNTTFDLCGDKFDFGDYNEDGYYEFNGLWPEGLNVKVDEKDLSVSFEMDGCIEIDDLYYKVGAVIVKGSNSSNVYYYEGGTLKDSGLAAPRGNRMVSNLTFCFVRCNVKPVVIAVKSFYWSDLENYELQKRSWAASSGEFIFENRTHDWCKLLGINYYPGTSVFPILDWATREEVGYVTVSEGVNCLIVSVQMANEGILDKTDLYVGDLEGINVICPDHSTWKWQDETNETSHTFVIPY